MSSNTIDHDRYDQDIPLHNVPHSPWADRYGIAGGSWHLPWFNSDGTTHSGLAPMFPPLALPQYFEMPNESAPPSNPPNEDEADKLYHSERDQLAILGGLRSWQLGAVNGVLHNGIPSGHSIKTSAEDCMRDWSWFCLEQLVKVHENAWIPCLRKSSWFDLHSDCTLAIRNPVPGLGEHYNTWWTVDNPAIWNAIRPALEIVNRILYQLIAEDSRWITTVFFGKRVLWANEDPDVDFDDNIKYKYAYRMYWPGKVDQMTVLHELRNRTERVQFHFIDETIEPSPGLQGLTRHMRTADDGVHWPVIGMTVGIIRPLLEKDSTLNERCLATFSFAKTLLHELGHAICNRGADNPIEPFYEDEWMAELGFSLEKEVFGYMTKAHPGACLTRGQQRGRDTHREFVRFPDIRTANCYSPEQREGRMYRAQFSQYSTARIVPSRWVSAVLTERFWAQIVKKYGKKALTCPDVFAYPYIERYDRHSVISAQPFQSLQCLAEFDGEMKQAMQGWEQRRQNWLKHRPWYMGQYRYWQNLPWSYTRHRLAVDKYRYHHMRRHTSLSRSSSISFLDEMKQVQETPDSTPGKATLDLYYMVSLLMFSSCPLTDNVGSLSPKRLPPRKPFTIYPSWEAHKKKKGTIGPLRPAGNSERKKFPPSHISLQLNALNVFYTALRELGWKWGYPKTWLQALVYSYTQIRAEREANPLVDSWTSFPFKIPPFSDRNWVKPSYDVAHQLYKQQTQLGLSYRYISPGQVVSTVTNYMSPVSSPSKNPGVSYVKPIPPLKWGGIDPWFAPPPPKPVQRLHIGEVGNHRVLTDAWVVHPDGNYGHDIYQITDLLMQFGADDNDYREIVKIGPMGPQLIENEARADAVRNYFKNPLDPIGKVIPSRHPEEISEFNGKNGMPLWITVGHDAYDLTSFPFADEQERDRFSQCGGGPLPENAYVDDGDWVNILRRLAPYCCAFIESKEPDDIPPIQYYTPRTLAWHDNPELGFYIAFGGLVYDVGIYLGHHPGGSALLIRNMGRDATQEFSKYHDLDIMKDHVSKRIGYLVPEVKLNEILGYHIVLNDWVYDISKLATSEPHLYGALQPYGGSDATAELSPLDSINCQALNELLERKSHCIVAGIAKTTLPDIPLGEVLLHREKKSAMYPSAWAMVSGYVYNIGDLVRHPSFYEHNISAFAGAEVTDPVLANWLVQNFEHRRIGRVVHGPAWVYPEPDPVDVVLDERTCFCAIEDV